MLKILYLFNEKTSDENEKYRIKLTLKDNRILRCVIKKKDYKLELIDSLPILPLKLEALGEDFGVKTLKTKFPYDFGLEENLFYKGVTPTINYYNEITRKEYNNLFTSNLSFKD